jgi:hypothetical protein
MDRRLIAWFLIILLASAVLAGCVKAKETLSVEEEISKSLTETLAAQDSGEVDGGESLDAGASQTAAAQAAGQAVSETQIAATVAAQETAAAQAAQAAQATAELAGQQATATFQAPVIAELPSYDVDPNSGHLAWVHRPVSLRAEGYRSDEFANDYIQMPVADFVMAADITWDSKYGDSGCGFILRSDGNPDAPSQYIVLISRSASGHAYYLAQVKGEVFNFRNWYANWLDPAFEWQNGTTNRLAVVARGPILKVYTNKTLVGTIDTSQPPPPIPELPSAPTKPSGVLTPEQQAQYDAAVGAYNQLKNLINRYHSAAVKAFTQNDAVYEQGLVGMFAFAYSGYITCDYDNAWLWTIDN